jgi:phenylacetate-coenzyme A ligase PaaK-like adenylate-forming protein
MNQHQLANDARAACTEPRPIPREMLAAVNTRLRRLLAIHFDPIEGTRFWLDRAAELGFDPRKEIQTIDQLDLLGELTAEDLRDRPLLDCIPRALHARLGELTVVQTGGTTGTGVWTAYRSDELLEAFVDPFVSAAEALGFPTGQQWLFIGPSGPHVIGKVVKHLAGSFASAEPFSVDFDPRWAKKLPRGSFAAQRYLSHVVEQSMSVINTQEIGVLFTTPPVLSALAGAMNPRQRERITAVHYGGMAIDPEELFRFQQQLFPGALHLSGYGNTLFGCALELSTQPGRQLEYFPHGDRLMFQVVDEQGEVAANGTPGRVRFSRLDETMLIVRMLERDVATLIPCPADAPDGFGLPGVQNPHTPTAIARQAAAGLY